MTNAPQTFNADDYKRTTLEQWQTAAAAWSKYGPLLRRWLGPATEQLFDMAGVKRGARVLDVAAGAGDQSLQAAQRVGAGGRVLATDISPKILEHAADNAQAAGLPLETLAVDGECLALPAGSFDVAISRVGLIYFPDQQRALKAIRHALRDGGRFGAIVYSTAENNRFFSNPVSIARRRANLGSPLPGQPGAFSLGEPEVLRATLEEAGFRHVEVATVAAPLRTVSAAECVRFQKESFGALHQMLAGLSKGEQESAWNEIHESLVEFETPDGFEGPCELLLAIGTK